MTPDAAPEVDLHTFAAAHAEGAVVLDVRTAEEYESGHVPGATLIPLDQLAARQPEIPEGDPLYVICAAGGRSMTATQALIQAGYHARSVATGTNGWREQGWALVSGPRPR